MAVYLSKLMKWETVPFTLNDRLLADTKERFLMLYKTLMLDELSRQQSALLAVSQ